MRAAVVGAGPAGIYAVESLARAFPELTVDVFDQLPTPYGLVRYGVAPDHEKMKSVIGTLHRVLDAPEVRFFGNVAIGDRLELVDLLDHYDAVLLATGAPTGRQLEIPGADLAGCITAAQFVAWYNGVPGAPPEIDLGVSTAVVVGAGNVALDAARILLSPHELLARTDIPTSALQTVSGSAVRHVHLVVRRGPEHVKFTLPELRDLGRMTDLDIEIDVADFAAELPPAARHEVKGIHRTMRSWADRPVSGSRTLTLHFWRTPARIEGDGRVERVQLQSTAASGGEPDEILEAGLLVAAIGYFGAPIPGLPFDPVTGTVPHEAGRVLGTDGRPVAGLYVTGWAKRGPQGIIGTNRADAAETVAAVAGDLVANHRAMPAETGDIADLLRERGVQAVTWPGWELIDRLERDLGGTEGRARAKSTDLDEMLAAARSKSRSEPSPGAVR